MPMLALVVPRPTPAQSSLALLHLLAFHIGVADPSSLAGHFAHRIQRLFLRVSYLPFPNAGSR